MSRNTFDVCGHTEIINRIKSNNRAVELLETIEKAMDEIYMDSLAKFLYADEEGNYMPVDSDTRDRDFYNNLNEWVIKNCTHLVKDSMEQYTRLK